MRLCQLLNDVGGGKGEIGQNIFAGPPSQIAYHKS